MIKENLIEVKKNICETALRCKRSPEDITLIAVSKTKPISDLITAYNEGVRDFGENKVQELLEKYDVIPNDARFHMIGHLQKNKVSKLIGKVYLIHGVDSYELAEVIQKESEKANIITNILIEVNVAKEATKFGVYPENTLDLVKKISELPNVRIKGLMTIAPYVENEEDNRQYFVKLRRLGIDINNQNIDNVYIGVYSMGMTGDYRVAVEEGATMVRVGTGIFGERDYTNV